MSETSNLTPAILPPRKENLLVFLLAAIQFTHVMDFVIMMPLGPQLMRIFSIDTHDFGLLVSSYTFSAGVAGIAGAFFLDRFDRRNILLVLYTGFTLGTLLCGLAPGYHSLLAARIFTGAFGGLIGASIFSILGDVIPYERRGAATGKVMAAFSVASVAGVPTGLFFASHWGWHATFILLAAMGVPILLAGISLFPPIKSHLVTARQEGFHPWKVLQPVLRNKKHQLAFLLMSLMMFGGFTIIPFISPYLVLNAGLNEANLPLIYLFGGGFTFFTSPWVGRQADKYGKPKVFKTAAILSIFPVLAITLLPQVPLYVILTVVVVFFITVNGRVVPAMAMVTGAAEPQLRGRFMSVNSAVQQLSSGVASYAAGLIIVTKPDGKLEGYWIVGLIAILAVLVATWVAPKLEHRSK